MKISEKWLREWVNPSITSDELVARLTMAGLEIDSVTPVAAKFSGVVVGQILSLAPHPDADKLRVCQVAGHPSGVLQVVCGAANAQQGLKIPFALVDARLPAREEGGQVLSIKSAKLRGVESHGMLCSARELGMETDLDGLMELPVDAPVGQDIRDYLNLDDFILEVNLTPNRGDCLSVRGLARELSALTGVAVSAPVIPAVKATVTDVFPVKLTASQCSIYAGRVIRNISTTARSPLWLQEKLRRSGIRTISPVVDVTNYVMFELGQPMHAFDLNKLTGKIDVRHSVVGECIALLNEQTIVLKEGTLLIADEKAPLAMAGIMGGSDSSVSSETRDLFLEAAYFEPLALAGKARNYGLHTDSSHRFERGVDFNLQQLAIERATALLLEIVGGDAGPVIYQENKSQLPSIEDIKLRLARIEQYLGLKLSASEIKNLLQTLGMQLIEANDNCLVLRPPSWRFDVRIEVDLLEEIARIYGYNRLPVSSFNAKLDLVPLSETHLPLDAVKARLLAFGYMEVVTYSFVDPVLQELLDSGAEGAQIQVQNPISADMGVMRKSLLPGLLATAMYNLNRQQTRVRIFETGLTFTAVGHKYQQDEALGILVCGSRQPENWFNNKSQLVDFYDIKGDIESLLATAARGQELCFKPSSKAVLHPGQGADVYIAEQYIGWVGALHPGLLSQLGLSQTVFVAQIAVNALKTGKIPVFEEVSRFPEVRRDLAVIVARELSVDRLCEVVKSAADSYLTNLKVFDVYSGEGIDPQRKSVALGLTFQAKSRTLTDSEINENVDRVISALSVHFQAELRS
jgi:phenylalanyl-tRNA synthetase beta chain